MTLTPTMADTVELMYETGWTDGLPVVPPTGDREELPPWLVDGILKMEDVIKAYYGRQGVEDLYEQQVPKK